MVGGADRAAAWSGRHVAILVAGLAVAGLVRAILLPTEGLTGDLDQFVLWVHGIATDGLTRAYDQNLSFPPVMAYVWAALAALEPAFRVATDSSDPAIRVVMKLPATIADFGLALGVAFALRERPAWAVAAALGIALHPAVIDVSAWWGQYESIFVLAGLIAYLAAVGGRSGLAAAALAVALMTKPQALPFIVPFAAWFLAREGITGAARAAVVGAATVAILWLPFLAAGGPVAYLRNLGEYQNETFAILSLRAWNPWWIVQEVFAGGEFVADSSRIGPLTLRLVGILLAGLVELAVFAAVLRSPTARSLALGLAAATLVAFTLLTTMHERYAFAALVFLAPLLPDRRVLALWLVFGVAFTLNLLGAAPPTPQIAAAVPIGGVFGIVGSLVLSAATASVVWLLLRSGEAEQRLGRLTAPASLASA